MENIIGRRKVINVLREMEVGAIEVFPLTQKTSILNTISNRLYVERADGMSWTTKTDKSKMIFIVTRDK